MEESEKGLVTSYFQSLKPVGDTGVDLLELLLDLKIDNELLKNIPFLKTVIGLYNFASTSKEHFEIVKLYAFIRSAASGMENDEERQKLLEKVHKNQKEHEKALARLLIILDIYSDIEKASILGKFYLAFLRERIKFEQLQMFAEIINQLLPNELKHMERELFIPKYKADIKNAYKTATARRLVALGLCYEELETHPSPVMTSGPDLTVTVSISRHLKLTYFGTEFFRIALDRKI